MHTTAISGTNLCLYSARLLILTAGIAVLCLAAAYGSEWIRYHKAGIS